MEHRDLIIIGAGPAGLNAAVYASYFDFKPLVFEENIPGGLASEIPVLENYPGFNEKISGKDLIDRMVDQCKEAAVEIRQFEKVTKLNLEGKEKIVETDKAQYIANAVLIASGRHPGMLGVFGEKEFRGKGVSYCAVCDRAFFKDRKVAVIGEGAHAIEVVLYLAESASSVVFINLGGSCKLNDIFVKKLEKQKINILTDIEVKEIKGDIKVKNVVLSDKGTGEIREVETDGVFLQLEEEPNSQLAKNAGIKVNKKGYIIVDEKGRTNLEGVYAIGDITDGSVKKVVTAVAQAFVAVNDIFEEKDSGRVC